MSDSEDETSSQGDPQSPDDLQSPGDLQSPDDLQSPSDLPGISSLASDKIEDLSEGEISAGEDDEEADEEKLLRDIRSDAIFDTPALSDDGSEDSIVVDSDEVSDVDTTDDEEDGFERLTTEIRKNTLEKFHPCLHSGTDEFAQAKSVITRGDDGLIDDPQHRTLPLLSKYERTKIIGMRAAQLAAGSAPLVQRGEQSDPFELATMELNARKIPFIVKRPLPDGQCEYWKLSDLTY